MPAREPNTRLRAMLDASGFSRKGLAKRVADLAARQGHSVSCNHTSVARWLNGMQPREPIPALVAEVFAEWTGQRVTPADIGMVERGHTSSLGLRYEPSVEDAIQTTSLLWRYDLERRDFLVNSVFAPSAASLASRDWLIGHNPTPARARGTQAVSMRDVVEITAIGQHFDQLSHQFGAQRMRRHMLRFLRTGVDPLLRARGDERTRLALFRAAAELNAAMGYMAVDCDELGFAQRYYTQALRFAKEAGDRDYQVKVMAANLGHLALYAGAPDETIQLARAAREGLRGGADPAAAAMAWSVQARGHAKSGDLKSCYAALYQAQRNTDRIDGANPPACLAYFDQTYLNDTIAHCLRDLGRSREAAEYATSVVAGLPATHNRRRAINTAILVVAHLQNHDLDGAATQAVNLFALSGHVSSPRSRRRVNMIREQLRPHVGHPAVGALIADGTMPA